MKMVNFHEINSRDTKQDGCNARCEKALMSSYAPNETIDV